MWWRWFGCNEGLLRSLARPVNGWSWLWYGWGRANIAPVHFPEHKRVLIRWLPRGARTWSWITFTATGNLFSDTSLWGDMPLTDVETSVPALTNALRNGAKWCQAFRVSCVACAAGGDG